LIAIVKKELQLDASLYTLLQILSVSIFEKTHISCALQCCRQSKIDPDAETGLTHVDFQQSQCWQRFTSLMLGSTKSWHLGQFSTGGNSLKPKTVWSTYPQMRSTLRYETTWSVFNRRQQGWALIA
jgi:hypothetical protein